MMILRSEGDYVTVGDKKFPKVAGRTDLEKVGARYLQTEKFRISGVEQNIEYMVLETDCMMVWKKTNGDNFYTLHLFAADLVKF